jgi:uncharacterized protein (UPF0332 family)
MKYDDLINEGRIHRQKISRNEIKSALERAERDLKTAQKIIGEDWDWGFAVAYNAVLQASRAYMYSKGFRPSSHENHKNTFAFMKLEMGKDFETLITYFDRMRTKRNRAMYDVAGLITEAEARSIFKKAKEFVKLIKSLLEKKD